MLGWSPQRSSMSHTPRSPRAAVPTLGLTPSRLIIPALKSSPSLSNLQLLSPPMVPSSPPPPVPPLPVQYRLESSASSVIDMEINTNEGILVQDNETEPDAPEVEETTVSGQMDSSAGDEESKKTLRDQLRRTLTHRHTGSDSTVRHRQKAKHVPHPSEMEEATLNAVFAFPPREYFVLTDAGKPVFVSRPGGEDSDGMTATIGLMQALISVFIDDNDKLRCINAGKTRITFLLRSPLYYVCVSSWGEPESVTRTHLDYLHLQILSIVTASQLKRIFERRTNFDLRRLLEGAEGFLTSLLDRMEFDLAMSLSSLHCLKLEHSLRQQAADALIPATKIKDVLYLVLVAQDRVVTLLRPRKHSIHPADIHIILNTINSPSILHSPATSSCIPLCLPKFNPSALVNAYITFLRRDGDSEPTTPSPLPAPQLDEMETPRASAPRLRLGQANVALVCISGGAGDFENIRGWCDSVGEKLSNDGTLSAIVKACLGGQCDYSVSELSIPGLRHFVYKSRAQVQITMPAFEDPYDGLQERRRLVTLYQVVHDSIHAKSGQEGPLKLQYLRTEKEAIMGWITQSFELYIALSPRLPKAAAINAAKALTRWVKREESRLFLSNAPVY